MSKNSQGYICGVVEGFYGRPWTTEQRKHLFPLLCRFGMNTYLYAPKDDLKHRAEWRELYTTEETALLQSLIKTATENGITFVYALSPGIDIIYSSPREVKALQNKLLQVRSLGCTAFSLLFDDIETKMNELDRKLFSSFVLAQLAVANNVYEFLGFPLFFFCPTEYCESGAMPNLEESVYLKQLGSKLHRDIHILWTGPRVVSRLLTVEHLQKVSSVIRRKPLIWDNLHANDYDPKRIFMGPFSGRSVSIKNETAGILLNPNCRYEANYIPLYTFSDWIHSEMDAPKVENDQEAVLESTVSEEAVRIVERSVNIRLYHPLTSLKNALSNWLPQFTQGPGPAIPLLNQQQVRTIIPTSNTTCSCEIKSSTIRICEDTEMLSNISLPIYTSPINQATTLTVQTFPITETAIGVVEAHEQGITKLPETVNSLTVDYSEPMDIHGSIDKEEFTSKNKSIVSMDMEIEAGDEKSTLGDINPDNIALFVDIFYLPFEHGKQGQLLLSELKWLYENAQIIRTGSVDGKEAEEWHRRFSYFQSTYYRITKLYKSFIKSPNKSLLQEIFPYLWETQGLISILYALLEWMRDKNLVMTSSIEPSHFCNNNEIDPDSEPWSLGGGLLTDLQKLVVISTRVAEIFTVKFAIPLSLKCYSIRPFNLLNVDKVLFYNLFAYTDEKKLAELVTGAYCDHSAEEFFFDRIFSPFLNFATPSHNFIVETTENDDDETSTIVCSIVLGIFDLNCIVDNFHNKLMPEFIRKYFQTDQKEEIEDKEHQNVETIFRDDIERNMSIPFCLPKNFLSKYQSFVEFRWPTNITEAISLRRLLHCISASLALIGSTGFFTMIKSDLSERIDLLTRLGLDTIEDADFHDRFPEFTFMGHLL